MKDLTPHVLQATARPGHYTPAIPLKEIDPFCLGRWMYRQGFSRPSQHNNNERLRNGWQFEELRNRQSQ